MGTFIQFVAGCTDLHNALHHGDLPCEHVGIVLSIEAFNEVLRVTVEAQGQKVEPEKVDFFVLGGILVMREGTSQEAVMAHRRDVVEQRQINYLTTTEMQGNA
ncbi:MAG: hypothetical protein IPO08_22025 [Xanthomonadales bacterium]|nr:hypothetical protein [Xanthomonadales bacterium]